STDDSPGNAKSGWGEYSEAAFPHPEFDWAVANQFAIKLDRDLFLGGNSKAFGLEIFQIGHGDGRAEDHILQIANNIEITDTLENDHIEEAIVDKGALEEREWSAVETAVANEDERAFDGCRTFGFDDKVRRRTRGNLRGRNQIAQRSKPAFEGGTGLF